MPLNSAMNAAVSGLQLNQRSMEIASHNISNANTEGYSRRLVHQAAASNPLGTTRGVLIADIERVTSSFLTDQVRTQTASLGRSELRDRYFSGAQDLFGDISSNNSMAQHLADMLTKMETLAIDPESPTAASALLDDASAFVRDLNSISLEIEEFRRMADLEIDKAVDDITNDLQLVSELNSDIARGLNNGATDSDIGDLQDQRDLALLRVGEKININTFTRSSGEIAVFTGNGRMLVDGDAIALDYQASASGTIGTVYSQISTADGISIQDDISDGSLKGLLEMRDNILLDLHRQMDALAVNARDVANAAHNRGSGLPAADTLTGSRVFADSATDTVTTASDARFVVMGSNGLTVATFDLPAGAYTIDELATAVDTGLDVDGSASVIGGRLVISATNANNGVGLVDLNGGADMDLTFDDGSGAVAFQGLSNFFGLNDFFQTPGVIQGGNPDGASGIIEVRSDILTNPERISRGQITTAATAPVVGEDRAIAIGDGTIIAVMAAAFGEPINIAAVGGLPPINKPLHEFAAEIIGLNSQQAADEKERLAFEEALIDQFQTRLSDTTGVNMDEELANILVLQNAFNASARVITTVDEMMEILTQLKR